MIKKLTQRGAHTVLPVGGDTIARVVVSDRSAPEIVFRDGDGEESLLAIHDQFVIGRGSQTMTPTDSKPGDTWSPTQLKSLVELVGLTVNEALALADGTLELLAGKVWTVRIEARDYESWHFVYPRPGQPIGGDGPHISLRGETGRLVL